MKSRSWLKLTMVAGLMVAGACARKQAPASIWLDDFAAAQAKARELNRPILANFSGSDWCPPCMMLEKEVFSQPAFQQYAGQHLVPFLADFPRNKTLTAEVKEQNDQLAEKYGAFSIPTILLLDAEGKVLAQTGYQPGGAEAYVEHLKQLLAGKPTAQQL